jgi:hypothetical protein
VFLKIAAGFFLIELKFHFSIIMAPFLTSSRDNGRSAKSNSPLKGHNAKLPP